MPIRINKRPRWVADVTNQSGIATSFVVYAVCVAQPQSYSVVASAPFNNPSGA